MDTYFMTAYNFFLKHDDNRLEKEQECVYRIVCMATCETNGFINHVSTIVTGSTVIPVSNPYNSAVADEHHIDLKNTPTLMPPRTDYLLKCSIAFGESSVDSQSQPGPAKLPPLQIQNSLVGVNPSQSEVPAFCHHESQPQLQHRLTPTNCCKSTPFRQSLQSPASRFRAYKQRLNQCTTRLHAARARCNTILTHILSGQNSSSSQQSVQDDEGGDETESSTDDELLENEQFDTVSQPISETLSNSEETWLCTRAISSSNWFWFLSELQRCRLHISRLNAVKARSRLSRLSTRPVVSLDSCSRTSPWPGTSRPRQTHHDMANIQTVHSLRQPSSSSILPSTGVAHFGGGGGEVTRCSCSLPLAGPCINCFQRTSESQSEAAVASPHTVDLLSAARPLGAHIHPKLSLPRDIQLSLRLESRLAVFSPVAFREHKTMIHPARNSPLQPRPTSLFTQLSDYGKRLHSLQPSTSTAIPTKKEAGEKHSGDN